MSYTGFYINLDRSPDRRQAMERQFGQYGLESRYRRFPAADGNSLNFSESGLKKGEMGCFISHYRLLKESLGQSQPLHVVEDDVLFAACTQQVIQDVIGSGALDSYDLIYTDTPIPTSNSYYISYKTLFDRNVVCDEEGRVKQVTFSVLDLQDKLFSTTSSFLVSPRSIDKIHAFYEAELNRGATLPIDLFIRNLAQQNKLKVGCVFPFVTSIRLDDATDTTIEARYDQLSVLARNIVRHSFFVGRDLAECRRIIDRVLKKSPDRHLQILLDVLGFSFSDQFLDI